MAYLVYKTLSDAPSFETFKGYVWPWQSDVLAALNRLSCAQEGATRGEANRKRKPIDALHETFQAEHDRQWKAWIESRFATT